jgi:hypothetical protein
MSRDGLLAGTGTFDGLHEEFDNTLSRTQKLVLELQGIGPGRE